MPAIATMIISGLTTSVLAQADQRWVGRLVVPKSADFILRHGDQLRERIITKIFFYRVKRADGPTLFLESHTLTGWALADEVIASDKAEEYFTDQVHLKPRDAFSYVVRGMILAQNKKFKCAAADFAHAIRLDRSFALAYFCRGELRGDTGEYAGLHRRLQRVHQAPARRTGCLL